MQPPAQPPLVIETGNSTFDDIKKFVPVQD